MPQLALANQRPAALAVADEIDDVDAGLRNFLYVDDVFRAIRDDLELSNEGLAEGDLVKQFLIDPGELDRVIGTR